MATRLTVPNDAGALAGPHARCFAHPWNADQMAGTLGLPTTRGWVTETGNVVHGFLLCQLSGTDAEILTLCTDPAKRRQGLARTLLDTGMVALRTAGATRLWLDVAADNIAALTLYEKCGFTLNGRRKNYYPRAGGAVDAILLESSLSI